MRFYTGSEEAVGEPPRSCLMGQQKGA